MMIKRFIASLLTCITLFTSPLFAVSTSSCYDTDTKAMLQFEGSDASTAFTDDSATANTFTAVGNAQIDTAQFKFGSASGLSDGTGDKINTPDNSAFDATGDFTVEVWVRFNSVATAIIWELGSYIGANSAGCIYSHGGPRLDCYVNGTALGTLGERSWSPSAGTWYHLVVMRSGSSVYVFIDGTLKSTTTESTSITPSNKLSLFDSNANDGAFNGWFDSFRYVVGTAVYSTSGFTSPSSPFTACAVAKRRILTTVG